MSQKEKKAESQLLQLVSSLLSGVLLAFGISVLLLFCAAHLVASGKLGEAVALNAEVIASAVGCLCGGVYTALSCRKADALLGIATGVAYYAAWTVIGLLCYTDVSVLDGVRNLIAAVAGGGLAGSSVPGCIPKESNCNQEMRVV